ncbi:MAG: hypothetical protein NC420_14465 [Eubacterium sp.]|nr:hypothetical protein [Eubacterium sp.]MCM1216342.1 hypothetical protein [Lachnospiraceae bacterium]MCM1305391.1 hypothetical protein [Butyrivibrio sp.]MCM1342895.1 hypothetical protein [Muribaculaceae bacterium]MCM1240109.1 hypothetical protein [Lachnospiraceae bacterium]
MKLKEAQQAYRAQRQELISQRKELENSRKALERKMNATVDGKELFAEEAATLELSIDANKERFEENLKVLNRLAEQEAAVWNAEVCRQQSDVMSDQALDMAKIMEVARRISTGGKVPATDERKLMDYSMELYMSAKNLAMLKEMEEKRKKYDSLWADEDEEQEEYDPQGKAEEAEVDIAMPEEIEPAVPEGE